MMLPERSETAAELHVYSCPFPDEYCAFLAIKGSCQIFLTNKLFSSWFIKNNSEKHISEKEKENSRA
jgi:hypothetical protein